MKCPGQDTRYWNTDAISEAPCPHCGKTIEFYKDDTSRKCHGCGKKIVNPSMDFGCASYCQFAEQCLGTLPEDFKGLGDDLLKDRLAVEVKRFLHTDFKTIQQTINRARFAENIGKTEGGDLAVILCSAYLQDISLSDAHNLLNKVNAAPPLIQTIVTLLSPDLTRTPGTNKEMDILHDAVTLNSIQNRLKSGEISREQLPQEQKSLKTVTGQEILKSL